MAANFQPWPLPLLPFFFIIVIFSVLPLSSSQSNSPQNIETFFSDQNSPSIPTTPPFSPHPPPPTNLPIPPRPVPQPSSSSHKSSNTSSSTVGKVVAATAASTLVVAGLLFFFLQRFAIARRRHRLESEKNDVVPGRLDTNTAVSGEAVKRFDGTLKGLIVDENGLDVIYWRKLESGRLKSSFKKELFCSRPPGGRGDGDDRRRGSNSRRERGGSSQPIQEIPLLRGKSSDSAARIRQESEDPVRVFGSSNPVVLEAVATPKPAPCSNAPPAPAPVLAPAPPPLPPLVSVKKTPVPPPPPPPIPAKKSPVPPPPPPPQPKPSQAGAVASSSRPPPMPKVKSNEISRVDSSQSDKVIGSETKAVQTKLKPLHWDKVTAKGDHSMVWDKISDGSFRFDDDLMEALFGYVATNKKSPERNTITSNLGNTNIGAPAQIFILDPRKSQNTAIVIRSLNISRQEILDALLEGQGLNADNLEKLIRISPTKEEENLILEFDGNPTKLADAESFLYHILKAVASPFARLDAMLFRSNYDTEILHLKESLQTLELGCKELRTRGLFLKLLEAVLKAGNRMNSGTARGNAQAFNLTALQKLSDVKSTDGKTTLLHFVVEEVVRSEGKRCVINRNYTLSRTNSQSSNSSVNSDNATSKADKEKEYMMLGLPVVGGLSVEFSKVKKAATIDYDAFINTCSGLTGRVEEIRSLLASINGSRGSGFVREMKGFLESAEEELKVVKEEQIRVMELVKKTTEYYQAGASKDRSAHALQLFIIVKDFLGMVDQVCINIARNLQKKKPGKASVGSSSPPPPVTKAPVRFPNLPAHFKSFASRTSSSSDSEDGF